MKNWKNYALIGEEGGGVSLTPVFDDELYYLVGIFLERTKLYIN